MPAFTGTEAGESLTGGAAADIINGLGGADTITGGGGADTIFAGDGNDLILGPGGAFGGPGGLIDGGAGVDTLDLGGYQVRAGFTALYQVTTANGVVSLSFFSRALPPPSTGPITLTPLGTATGVENFIFGPGVDSLDFSGLGSVTVSGGGGSDTIIGGSQASVLLGGEGNDRLSGQFGADRLEGGAGNDTLTGGGNDVLVLARGQSDYMFQQTANGWTIYEGRQGYHTVANVEQVQFNGGGASMSFQQAAAGDFDARAVVSSADQPIALPSQPGDNDYLL